MKNNVIVLMFFVFFGCANRVHKTNIPNWYLDLPQIDGEIVVVGTGQEEGDALLTGLYQLFNQYSGETKARATRYFEDGNEIFETSMLSKVNQSFGNFFIQGRTERIQDETNNKLNTNHFSEAIKLVWFYDDQEILLTSTIEEVNDVALLDIYEIVPPTYDIDLLYDELEKSGIYIKKKYDHNDQYFLMLTAERSLVRRIVKEEQLKLEQLFDKFFDDALKKFGISSFEELDNEKKEEFWEYFHSIDPRAKYYLLSL